MVPEITSMQNGYAFLKFALFRRLQRAISGVRVSEKLNATFGNDVFAIGSAMDKVSTFFSLLEDEVPELVEHFKLLLAEFNASIVGNMLHRPEDQNALFAIQRVVRERLGIHVELAASIRQNPNMRNSVNAGQPFAVTGGRDPDAAEIHQLARNVLQQDLAPIRGLRDLFLRAMARVPAPANVDARFEFGLGRHQQGTNAGAFGGRVATVAVGVQAAATIVGAHQAVRADRLATSTAAGTATYWKRTREAAASPAFARPTRGAPTRAALCATPVTAAPVSRLSCTRRRRAPDT